MTVNGTVAAGFEPVRDVFESQFAEGRQIGASVAVYHQGKLVVDLWGGTYDETSATPWQRDTMAICYSVTKGLSATCVHVLAGRGLIDYEKPVAHYWPEFATNGKEKITVRQLLSHRAGIPLLPEGLSADDLCDWELMVTRISQLAPVWEPGTAAGYHALNFGWLAGELVRRVDGRDLGAFLTAEVARPLGIEREMYIGAPAEAEPRIAPLTSRMRTNDAERKAWEAHPMAQMLRKAGAPETGDTSELMNSPKGHQAQIPAINGVMTGRALARMYAAGAGYGEVDGVRLFPESTVRAMSEVQSNEPDKIIFIPIAWSLGFMNGGPGWPQGPRSTSFGHPGLGGSTGFADPEIGMSFGLVMNALESGLTGAGRGTTLADAARACIAAVTA